MRQSFISAAYKNPKEIRTRNRLMQYCQTLVYIKISHEIMELNSLYDNYLQRKLEILLAV